MDAHDNILVIGQKTQPDTGQYERLVMRKYSPEGQLLWEQNFEGVSDRIESTNAIATDRDGNLLLAGLSWPLDQNRSYSWLIRKFTNSADPRWRRLYSSPARLGDSAFSIAADPKGNVVVVGYEDRGDLGQATNWLVMKFRQDSPCP